ncbi:MAG: aspartate--tRNA ligase [Clostridiales bacterium]|jgi:aspartyl-tRNA synthetase|nr:aspartate--tRNA ligase [Clostridiales bacterium]
MRKNMRRTHTCNELRDTDAGKTVRIEGWLQGTRDIGNIIFATIRDFYGVTQITADDEKTKNELRSIPRESTVAVDGRVVLRSAPNPKLPTGLIEIAPTKIEVLGRCSEQLPFEIGNSLQSKEETRLKYRFLDLRNPTVKDKIVLRSRVVSALRAKMTARGFLEITTPILTSSSPEGARDYIVPSRVHPGKFYALPQAPQIFKQILMTAGFDKYFQIAPCFRDEDARADRSPGEFYQMDMEMAFASQEDVFTELEGVLPEIFREFSDKRIAEVPFPRITYRDAVENYGSDKPDLRNPLFVKDITAFVKDGAFADFKENTVKAVVVQNFAGTRKTIDETVEYIGQNEGKLFWVKTDGENRLNGGIAKFLTEKENEIKAALNLAPNAFVGIVAGKKGKIEKTAGLLRTRLGEVLGLTEQDVYKFCWIVDFPMYEIGEESGQIEFCHNPFSMPQGGLDALNNMNPLDILAYQYDIVCNGIELSSGAVRNHNPEALVRAFEIVGLNENVVASRFPAMYNAFHFGAPPHAGIAPGVDRMVMLLAGEPNIREVIAFPMNKNAQDLMMGAPSALEPKQLLETHIAIKS